VSVYAQAQEARAHGGIVTRSITLAVREVDKDSREAEFVASTETPVDMGWGDPEVLRTAGARLERYQANPVVLDSHNRCSLGDVVGQAVSIEREDRQLVVRIRFSEATQSGRQGWALVQEGSLRAVSIGYRVCKILEVPSGEEDGEGDGLVRGPAVVVTEWELLEVSLVPVPADPNALKRAYAAATKEAPMAKRKTKAGPPWADDDDEDDKKKKKKKKAAEEEEEKADDEDDEEEKAEDEDDEEEKAEDEDDEEKAEDEEDDEDEKKKKKSKPRMIDAQLASERKARKSALMAICPSDLRKFAEDLILAQPDATLEEWRAEVIAQRRKPVGTPPAPRDAPRNKKHKTPTNKPSQEGALNGGAIARLLKGA